MPAHKKVQRNLEVVRLYKSGVIVKKLAKMYRVHRTQIEKVLKRECRVNYLIEIPLDDGVKEYRDMRSICEEKDRARIKAGTSKSINQLAY